MAESNVGTVIPGEDASGGSQAPIIQSEREVAVETKARAQGWKPEEEFTGELADWVPAKEFLGRQSLFDKIHSLRSENKKLGADLEVIKSYVANMSQLEYNKALTTLRNERREAIKEADVEATEAIDKQIGDLTRARATPPVPAGPPPEFKEWVEKNEWYANDADLREEADTLGAGYVFRAQQQGRTVSVADTLKYVADKIKTMHPEKIDGEKGEGQPPRKKALEVEGGGGGGGLERKKGKLTESDLTDQERTVMRSLVARKVITKEKYLSDLAERYATDRR